MYNETNKNNELLESDLLDPIFEAFMPGLTENSFKGKLMKTDIEEKDGEFLVTVDMPGINKENVKVSLKNGYLTVGYKQNEAEENKDEKRHFIRKERYFGEGERTFYLGEVESSKVEAKMENGILNIVVPKLVKEEDSNLIEVK